MTDRLKMLAEMQHEVDECRRLALEIEDHEALAKLNRLADRLAQHAWSLALRYRNAIAAASSQRRLDS
jgi:hypothetical protein